MPKYIAFLRAINVGGHVVKMDYLKNLFVEIGFENVETFIASGNVIFDFKSKNKKSIKDEIEKTLRIKLGYNVTAFIRTVNELKSIAEYNPFGVSELTAKENILYIAFLDNSSKTDLQKKILSMSNSMNEFHFNEKELYWLCRKKFSESEFSGKTLEKILQTETTIRNSTTVRKIAAKLI
jgi:uncharacterized protein (DUF1697 family)